MKTYVITLANTFPAGHPKVGQPTYFREKVDAALNGHEHAAVKTDKNGWMSVEYSAKIHTIRTNVALWARRMNEVEAGEACLSIREWAGRPYLSKQVEIARLTREDGVGMQRLDGNDVWAKEEVCKVYDKHGVKPVRAEELAMKDGLSLEDWRAWFEQTDADSEPRHHPLHALQVLKNNIS